LKGVPGVTAQLQAAVDTLFARSQEAKGAVLGSLQPELALRRKRQQAVSRLSAAGSVDISFAQTLLDPEAAPYPLHAGGHADQPALNDVIAIESPGLAAAFFFRDTATGVVDLRVPAAPHLDYSPVAANSLPANPTPGAAISGSWQGRVEIPEPGYYNIVIEVDAGRTMSLTVDGQVQLLTQNGAIWRNANPLQLKAGRLYDIKLMVEKLKDRLSVKMGNAETPSRGDSWPLSVSAHDPHAIQRCLHSLPEVSLAGVPAAANGQ
jgi:hypothetical protein